MPANPGRLPEGLIVRDENGKPTGRYRRAIVTLRNGMVCGREPNGGQGLVGWDAQTTRWDLTNHPYDVVEFEIV